VHVTVDEAHVATCSRANCNIPLTGVAPGRHFVQIDVEDTAEELVWQTRIHMHLPRWPSSLLSNVAVASNGGRAEAVYSQGGFPVQGFIDGAVEEDPNNGWAYHGRLDQAIAMVVFNHTRIVRTISMVSGLARNDHHVTEFALWSTTDPSPSLASSAEGMWQPMLCSGVEGGAVRSQGEGKYSVVHPGTPVSEVIISAYPFSFGIMEYKHIVTWSTFRPASWPFRKSPCLHHSGPRKIMDCKGFSGVYLLADV
jgi:hypothetical protein